MDIGNINSVVGTQYQSAYAEFDQPNTMSQDDFLKLLTVQMTHQDPLSPMDQSDMLAQLSDMTVIEQMEAMQKQNVQVLLGTQVEAYDKQSRSVENGVVTAVDFTRSEAAVIVNGRSYDFSDIRRIYQPEAQPETQDTTNEGD